ncbi:uncharacterized protein LOC129569014 [Sitodiplosis mosellana]|uniref:uncharacterized protein LOC129569014 n=1 Tax=Sitodiplosis mosellana TaxID=263140 RepID=UPI002445239A|nr:uncharacterized protein LOC129569014 [Sitodiplosis mosellana]
MGNKCSSIQWLSKAEMSNLDVTKNQCQLAVVADPSHEASELFTLNIDCLEEIFEWLSTKELFALRQTCKRMKRIIDFYIRAYYPTIGRFRLYNSSYEIFQNMDADSIKLINRIVINLRKDKPLDIKKLKNVLNNVEVLIVEPFSLKFDIYKNLLKYCKNIKSLRICSCDATGDKWLHKQYPTLEHVYFYYYFKRRHLVLKRFRFRRIYCCCIYIHKNCSHHFRTDYSKLFKTSTIVKFFCANPQIHTLSTCSKIFEVYANALFKADVKFKQLNIFITYLEDFNHNFYKELYDEGFYERLYLFGSFWNEDIVPNNLMNIGLEKFSIENLNFKLPLLLNLKEIQCSDCHDLNFFENVWDVVERLSYAGKSVDIIFILRNFRKLKHFRVKLSKTNIIDLSALNKERETLIGAYKTTIYVGEDSYLATKFALSKIDYSLIELKRDRLYDLIPYKNNEYY